MGRLTDDIAAGIRGVHGAGEALRGSLMEATDKAFDKNPDERTLAKEQKHRAIAEKGKADVRTMDETIASHEWDRKRRAQQTGAYAPHAGGVEPGYPNHPTYGAEPTGEAYNAHTQPLGTESHHGQPAHTHGAHAQPLNAETHYGHPAQTSGVHTQPLDTESNHGHPAQTHGVHTRPLNAEPQYGQPAHAHGVHNTHPVATESQYGQPSHAPPGATAHHGVGGVNEPLRGKPLGGSHQPVGGSHDTYGRQHAPVEGAHPPPGEPYGAPTEAYGAGGVGHHPNEAPRRW